jgi:hypothetical protein
MKRVILFVVIAVAMVSCSKKDVYKDISATGVDYPTCPNGQPTYTATTVVQP